jgi:hypothetical protein
VTAETICWLWNLAMLTAIAALVWYVFLRGKR